MNSQINVFLFFYFILFLYKQKYLEYYKMLNLINTIIILDLVSCFFSLIFIEITKFIFF